MNSEFVGLLSVDNAKQICYTNFESRARDYCTNILFVRDLYDLCFSFLEVRYFRRFQLKLQFVSDQGDEFRIRGFSLGIADGIAEKSLQSVQIPSVPGYFDGMADSTLHSGRCGLECFRHLGVQYLGDGIGVPYGPPGSLVTLAFDHVAIS